MGRPLSTQRAEPFLDDSDATARDVASERDLAFGESRIR
jgi:hypothetical protein